MPSCPVCGKEVQSATAYCPACGTSLKQTGPVSTMRSTMQTNAYSQNSPSYSSPQQGYGMPTPPQSHSHRKYILAIIVVGLIALVAGGLIASTFLIGPDVTDVTGAVTIPTLFVSTYHGTPNRVLFASTVTGNLSAGVFPDNAYQVYLPILSSGNYVVSIQWTNVTGGAVSFYSCKANPSTFSSSNQNATQNFSC